VAIGWRHLAGRHHRRDAPGLVFGEGGRSHPVLRPVTTSSRRRRYGARALGRDDLGRLAASAKADIALIDPTGITTVRWSTPSVRWPVSGTGQMCTAVWVEGRKASRPGCVLHADEPASSRGGGVFRARSGARAIRRCDAAGHSGARLRTTGAGAGCSSSAPGDAPTEVRSLI
jgi:hypothetical protein